MIERWLTKKILAEQDPERVLAFCALFGALHNLGIIGTVITFWNLNKKRKAQNGKQPKQPPKQ